MEPKTKVYYVSPLDAQEWNKMFDDQLQKDLFEAKCDPPPEGGIDMVWLYEYIEDQQIEWKPGWYFEHEDGDWGGPFATKEEAEDALVLVQQEEATLEQLLLWQSD